MLWGGYSVALRLRANQAMTLERARLTIANGSENGKGPLYRYRGPSVSQLRRDLFLCGFLFFDLFASGLVDHFHGQAHFAAIVKAQKLHFHFLTFF